MAPRREGDTRRRRKRLVRGRKSAEKPSFVVLGARRPVRFQAGDGTVKSRILDAPGATQDMFLAMPAPRTTPSHLYHIKRRRKEQGTKANDEQQYLAHKAAGAFIPKAAGSRLLAAGKLFLNPQRRRLFHQPQL